MMAAEEMDADWTLVRVKEAPALDATRTATSCARSLATRAGAPRTRLRLRRLPIARWVGSQVTGGSTAVRGTGVFGMRSPAPPRGNARRGRRRSSSASAQRNARAQARASCTRRPDGAPRFGELAASAAASRVPTSPTLKIPMLHDPPHRAASHRHPVEGRRQRDVRHRLHHARHAATPRSRSLRSTAAAGRPSTRARPKRCRA